MQTHTASPTEGCDCKGKKAPEHAENVTMVASVNAVGNCEPPMITFKGVNTKPSYGDDLPPLATVEMAPKV